MSLAPIGTSDPRAALGSASSTPAPVATQVGTPSGTSQADPTLPITSQVPPAGELQAAVDTLNRAIQATRGDLAFSIDQDSKRVIVKVINPESGDVIRQIPSEEALALSQALQENRGLILNYKA